MIRHATVADAAAIAAIWNPIIRDTDVTFNPVEKTEADVAALIADRQAAGHATFVGLADGAVLGFASYAQFRAGPGYARTMEHTVNLAPAARGHGLGRALMSKLSDHASARGLRSLIGAITATNAASLAFHRSLGFAEVGRIPDAGWKFGQYHALVLMQKLLDPPHGQGTRSGLE